MGRERESEKMCVANKAAVIVVDACADFVYGELNGSSTKQHFSNNNNDNNGLREKRKE